MAVLLFTFTMPVAVASPSVSRPTCHGDASMPVGYHEFEMFGGDAVYISHYAMFSSLHAYQALARVTLAAPDHDAEARFLAHLAGHPGLHYTLSPYRATAAPHTPKDQDDWVLPDMMQEGRTFNADIHYRENGKDVILDANVVVTVRQVVDFHLLDPSHARPSALTYVVFGDGTHTYLAHKLSAPSDPGAQTPDFDQVVAVRVEGRPADSSRSHVGSLPGRANSKDSRLKVGDEVTLVLGDGTPLELAVTSEVFARDVPTER